MSDTGNPVVIGEQRYGLREGGEWSRWTWDCLLGLAVMMLAASSHARTWPTKHSKSRGSHQSRRLTDMRAGNRGLADDPPGSSNAHTPLDIDTSVLSARKPRPLLGTTSLRPRNNNGSVRTRTGGPLFTEVGRL